MNLTSEERGFLIWALHYVADSDDLLDMELIEQARALATKIRDGGKP